MHSGRFRKAALKSVSAFALILMLSIAVAFAATPARAQDGSSSNSDSGYQDDQVIPNNDMSDPDPGDSGQSMRVPIPGGGDVSVDGPDSDQQESPPSQNWSTDSQQPNSVGGGAADPQ
jgi:hypothetical protein